MRKRFMYFVGLTVMLLGLFAGSVALSQRSRYDNYDRYVVVGKGSFFYEDVDAVDAGGSHVNVTGRLYARVIDDSSPMVHVEFLRQDNSNPFLSNVYGTGYIHENFRNHSFLQAAYSSTRSITLIFPRLSGVVIVVSINVQRL